MKLLKYILIVLFLAANVSAYNVGRQGPAVVSSTDNPYTSPANNTYPTNKSRHVTWYSDSAWWAVMYDPDGVSSGVGDWTIYKKVGTTWTDQNVSIDAREISRPNVLYDGTYLWVYSIHNTQARIYRLSYSAGWSIDSGYPYNASGAHIPTDQYTDTFTVDTNGYLWCFWIPQATGDQNVQYGYSSDSGQNWTTGALSTLSAQTIAVPQRNDKLYCLKFNDGTASMGLVIGDEVSDVIQFVYRTDATAISGAWQTPETIESTANYVNDHLDALAYGTEIYLVSKTGISTTDQPTIVLYDRSSTGTWSKTTVWDNQAAWSMSRPRIAIDSTDDAIYVFGCQRISGVDNRIIFQKTPVSSIAFVDNETGTVLIDRRDDNIDIDNVCIAKEQICTATTGIYPLAVDNAITAGDRYYYWGTALPARGSATHIGLHVTDTHDGSTYYTNFLTHAGTTLGLTVDFVVSSGDLARSGVNYFGTLRTAIDNQIGSGVPLIPIPGNHDSQDAQSASSKTSFDTNYSTDLTGIVDYAGPTGSNTTMYAFDFGAIRFVGINIFWDGGTDSAAWKDETTGNVNATQLAWIKAAIDDAPTQQIITLTHDPAWPQRARHLTDSLNANEATVRLFWQALADRNVLTNLNGHTHEAWRFQIPSGYDDGTATWNGTDEQWPWEIGNGITGETGNEHAGLIIYIYDDVVEIERWRDTDNNGTYVKDPMVVKEFASTDSDYLSQMLTYPVRTTPASEEESVVSLVQSASNSHAYNAPALSITVTLDSTATEDNILYSAISIDKNSGTITVPTGWTLIQKGEGVSSIASASGAMAYKISDGTETSLTWNWTVSQEGNAWAGEYFGLFAQAPDVSAENETYLETATASLSTGTTTSTDALTYHIAMIATDSGNSVGSSRVWTGDYVLLFEEPATAGSGEPFLHIATNELAATGTVGDTITFVTGSDEAYGAVVAFEIDPDATPPVSSDVIIIPEDSYWKYEDTETDLYASYNNSDYPNWTTTDYLDGGWDEGQAPMGYGEVWLNTTTADPGSTFRDQALYIRKAFDVFDAENATSIVIETKCDDGCVLFLNNVEIARYGVAAGALAHDTLTNQTVGATPPLENTWYTITQSHADSSSLLRNGKNQFAVSTHQVNATSSDLVFELRVTIVGGVSITNPVSGNYTDINTTNRIGGQIQH